MTTDNSLTEAMILVGGKGERLRSVINNTPKPMAEVSEKPFLEWLILFLKKKGIRRVVLCSGYMAEAIEAYFGDGTKLGVKILYSVDPFPLGTGGAIIYALNHIQSKNFLVLNGDSFCQFNLNHFYKFHLEKKAKASILLTKASDCSRFGSVNINNCDEIISFIEKSNIKCKGLINAGVYILEADLMLHFPQGQAISIEKEIFPRLIGCGLYAFTIEGVFCDIGTPESYIEACQLLSNEFEYVNNEEE